MKRMAQDAERVKRGRFRRRKTGTGVAIDATEMNDIVDLAEELQMRVADKAMAAAARVIQRAYRKNLDPHRSKRVRDYEYVNERGNTVVTEAAPRDFWSAKARAKNEDRHGIDLRRAVGMRRIYYKRSGNLLRMVGIKRPYGSHANLIEYGANVKLWGREDTWRMPPYAPLRRAAAETQSQQRAAVVNLMKAESQKWINGG